MRTRSLLFAAAFVGPVGFLAADPPPKPDWTGKVKWVDKYPKAYPAEKDEKPGVEVFGKYEAPEGWVDTGIEFNYYPKAGGSPKRVDKVARAEGKFGAIDRKTDKVVPLKVPLDPGEWTVWVMMTYERRENGRVLETVQVTTPLVNVEVK